MTRPRDSRMATDIAKSLFVTHGLGIVFTVPFQSPSRYVRMAQTPRAALCRCH
jgi:hypothetical protein